MKLVIEMSEDDYRKVQDGRASVSMMRKAIANGTPLPKGHGRILIVLEDIIKRELISLDFSCQKWVSEVGLSNATVEIIKTEKEVSE